MLLGSVLSVDGRDSIYFSEKAFASSENAFSSRLSPQELLLQGGRTFPEETLFANPEWALMILLYEV